MDEWSTILHAWNIISLWFYISKETLKTSEFYKWLNASEKGMKPSNTFFRRQLLNEFIFEMFEDFFFGPLALLIKCHFLKV